MARRARSGMGGMQILGIIIGLLAAFGAIWMIINVFSDGSSRGEDNFRNISEMSISDYLENGNSLRGNTYKVTGVVDAQLGWDANAGRLFSIDVPHDRGSDPIPIRVPGEFDGVNIQRGQEFVFKVSVKDKGILIAEAVEKI